MFYLGILWYKQIQSITNFKDFSYKILLQQLHFHIHDNNGNGILTLNWQEQPAVV